MSLSAVSVNAAIFTLAAALLLACGDSGAPTEKPTEPPPKTAPLPPDHPPVTRPAPTPPPPEPAEVDDPVARGNEHYQLYCASCHGAGGAGDGPVAAGLDPKPASHNDGNYMNALSDEHLTKVIKEGGASIGKSPLMAPWGGTLSDEQVADVIAFIRSLAEPVYEGP